MGAAIAHFVGKLCRRNWFDCKVLIAAGAGAGLATAFNAPIAGAIFVLEELMRHFHTRTAIAALGASAAAIAVARTLLGQAPDFAVAPIAYVGLPMLLLAAALGAAAGLAGILYNAALLRTLSLTDRLRHWPVEVRAALIGAVVGAVGWFLPVLVGGGDNITQRALTGTAFAFLPLAFLLRFVLGVVSYAAATPGGLFAPILVLGAQLGLLATGVFGVVFPDMRLDSSALAVVGMAAFFTGVVQAPITGIALVIEMTGSLSMLLPMIGACFTAMLIPNLAGRAPIYDSLRSRIVRTQGSKEFN
jgi:CIC family chloride channel protein